MPQTLVLLPGDGIGPEVCAEVRRVADWMAHNAGLDVRIDEHPVGGGAFDRFGDPLPAQTRAAVAKANAVLLGAVGGPKWMDAPRHLRPEAGLLALRKAMGVYANLRPAFCFPSMAGASTLKPEIVAELDLVLVRELTGGVYFGEPRGITTLADGTRRGVDTQVYTTPEIERVARVAFELARARRNHVTSVEKANVMETGLLWRETVTALHKKEYADVTLDHMYADNTAMQLVRNPRQFDVLVTDNLFGDVLSDEASMLAGSIGLLPSASLGAPGTPGLYEPIHGSAPDIAGNNLANPMAAILSFEMALRWSLKRADLADMLHAAVRDALEAGSRTRDIGGTLGTTQAGDAVLRHLELQHDNFAKPA